MTLPHTVSAASRGCCRFKAAASRCHNGTTLSHETVFPEGGSGAQSYGVMQKKKRLMCDFCLKQLSSNSLMWSKNILSIFKILLQAWPAVGQDDAHQQSLIDFTSLQLNPWNSQCSGEEMSMALTVFWNHRLCCKRHWIAYEILGFSLDSLGRSDLRLNLNPMMHSAWLSSAPKLPPGSIWTLIYSRFVSVGDL